MGGKTWQGLRKVRGLRFRLDTPHVHPELFCRAHGLQNAVDHLSGSGAAGFVSGPLFHQLGHGKDGPEVIVQPVKKKHEFRRLFHIAPIEQVGDR
jgi:hypothetical protein